MKRIGWILALLVLIAGVVWGSWPGEAEPEVRAAVVASSPVGTPVVTPANDAAPVPNEEAPAAALPHTARVGHQHVAEALGLVGIRCFVGSEYDGDNYVGAFHQRVEDGWYSHVEVTLEGERVVEQRFEGADGEPEFESRFIVRWSASEPGQTVPCEVERMMFSTAHITVLDPQGEPQKGARVYGCGGHGRSDDAGVVEFPIHAGHECTVTASAVREGLRAQVEVEAIEEDVPLTLTIDLEAGPLFVAEDYELHVPEPITDRPETAEEWEQEAATFDAWALDASGTEKALYQRLAAHRRRMADLRREQARAQEARDALMERMRSGERVSPEELRETMRVPLPD